MGIPAYICYIAVVIYILVLLYIFIKKWNYVEHHKRMSILTIIGVLLGITSIQMIFPEILFTSLGVTMSIVGIYINLENPAYKKLSNYNQEVVIAFANIIENRDDNTGGHVKRTSMYVKMIATELAKNSKYKNILTKDYIENLVDAAPMHDIGKIAVSDAILQKKGKLTEDEFEEIKKHSVIGAEIINNTFSNLSNEEYCKIACDVAKYHHERWNGKGYPEGLKENEIPLSARIMAVADVFDAVSEDRCYREAMSLKECYKIIEEGKGTHFDPIIVDVFLSNKYKVEQIHSAFKK
jgi:HD-GYP domain-containing protein (c-di-GMP phosphodiesterase class II)